MKGGDDDLIAQHILNKRNSRISFSRESQTISKTEKSWSGLISQKVRHMKIGRYYSKKNKTLAGLSRSAIQLVGLSFNFDFKPAVVNSLIDIRHQELSFYYLYPTRSKTGYKSLKMGTSCH